ncbi:Galactokinase [Acidisarcina polymorpha]|uniref:Galactokinase n=1 Tax=Acidisarcina polymorpha TaxID=2211140 RepID=A0A2Z5G5R4_9BACT|nr:galactokinase family protein [Acidisarcina polymorpha]AXC14084.1 Galactokinase [Acidisarcina polymorpha]
MGSWEEPPGALLAVKSFFESAGPVFVARAPGRLDVMGGNVDYTGGLVLQSLLREAVWVAAQTRSDGRVRLFNPGATSYGWDSSFECLQTETVDAEQIRVLCTRQESSRWAAFALGALHYLGRFHGACISGMDLFFASDLPPNRGVSSSAALAVATLKAASGAYGISLHGIALATAAQWVENVIAGAACGIMDQAAIVLGRSNHLLPLLCQPCDPRPPLALPPEIALWGIDSMAPRATTGTAYEVARAAAFIAYKLICRWEGFAVIPDASSAIPRWTDARWSGYLSSLAPSEFRARYERRLPEVLCGGDALALIGEHADPFTAIHPELEYPIRGAAQYAVDENFRVQTLYAIFQDGNWSRSESTVRLAGEILCQSHYAYSECGLASPACDDLVARALAAGFPGAKMTGGGGGGVVAVLGHRHDHAAVERLAREYGAPREAVPHLFEGSSPGADTYGVRRQLLSLDRLS